MSNEPFALNIDLNTPIATQIYIDTNASNYPDDPAEIGADEITLGELIARRTSAALMAHIGNATGEAKMYSWLGEQPITKHIEKRVQERISERVEEILTERLDAAIIDLGQRRADDIARKQAEAARRRGFYDEVKVEEVEPEKVETVSRALAFIVDDWATELVRDSSAPRYNEAQIPRLKDVLNTSIGKEIDAEVADYVKSLRADVADPFEAVVKERLDAAREKIVQAVKEATKHVSWSAPKDES